MENFKIITDACCDLPPELAEVMDVHIIPMMFTIDGQTYQHHPNRQSITPKEFYQRLKEGAAVTTVALNPQEYLDAATPYLEQKQDVLIMAFSSGLSSTYHNALVAIDALKEQYPDRQILVSDSLAASMGFGLLVWHAAQLQKQGKSVAEVCRWIESNKLSLCHWFTVDDLYHLKRGGRISATTAVAGTMLSVKPVLHIDNAGHLINVNKKRGRKASLRALADMLESTAINPSEQMIFISHGDSESDAMAVKDMLQERLGCKQFQIGPIGPIIGAHSGAGTVALFFFAKDRSLS